MLKSNDSFHRGLKVFHLTLVFAFSIRYSPTLITQ